MAPQVEREHAEAGVAEHGGVGPDALARVRAAVDEDNRGPVPRRRVPGREGHAVGGDEADVRKARGRRANLVGVAERGVRREADGNDQEDDHDERDGGDGHEPQGAARAVPAPVSAVDPPLAAAPGHGRAPSFSSRPISTI